MIEEVGVELWIYPAEVICITTNGTVKRDGRAVMGRGCAREAAILHPELPYILGQLLKNTGNVVQELKIYNKQSILAFPVKHNWWEKADLQLIELSCQQLMNWLQPDQTCVLPRPGCGNGKLDWKTEVKPICEKYLGDNVTVISRKDK